VCTLCLSLDLAKLASMLTTAYLRYFFWDGQNSTQEFLTQKLTSLPYKEANSEIKPFFPSIFHLWGL